MDLSISIQLNLTCTQEAHREVAEVIGDLSRQEGVGAFKVSTTVAPQQPPRFTRP